MSHNVKLGDTQFTNLTFLKRAVEELAKEGSPISWVEGQGTKMRGAFARTDDYSQGQEVDACIKIADGNTGSYGNWDIGFKWNPEAKKYDVITDSDLAYHGEKLGLGAQQLAKTIEGPMCTLNNQSRMLGRLIQRYNIIRDETTAAKAGYLTRRIPGKDGQMMLEAEVRG